MLLNQPTGIGWNYVISQFIYLQDIIIKNRLIDSVYVLSYYIGYKINLYRNWLKLFYFTIYIPTGYYDKGQIY